MNLPPVILLSDAIIDREARLIIEWDQNEIGKIWIDNGMNKYFYTGEDAQRIWDFYRPLESWKDS